MPAPLIRVQLKKMPEPVLLNLTNHLKRKMKIRIPKSIANPMEKIVQNKKIPVKLVHLTESRIKRLTLLN